MKELKVLITFTILSLMVCMTSVHAATVTQEEYNKLHTVFSNGRIAVMSDEEAQEYLNQFDFDNLIHTHKYFKVTETTNGSICQEVSEAQAMAAVNELKQSEGTRGPNHSTTYKHINISVSSFGNNVSNVNLYTEWLVTPKVKSFDVTGIRVYDATVVSGSQSGTQIYWANGNYDTINYAYNGTNIVNYSNGFGISMNLVDAGSYFATEINANVTATSQFAHVYGAYEHATSNVTLAQSQAYTISPAGLGNVFNFVASVDYIYDGMNGVDIALPNTY